MTTKIRKFDEIQIDGIYPRNPITDDEIKDFLQLFAVINDQSGDFINPRDLTPRCAETEPIIASRVRSVNYVAYPNGL